MRPLMKIWIKPIITSVVLVVICLTLTPFHFAEAAKKKRPQPVVIHIPVETIDALKESNLPGALRNLRMAGESPQTNYLKGEMQRIERFNKCKRKDHKMFYNTATAYHNLYLFLLNNNIDNKTFYKKALDLYKRAYKTKSPERRATASISMAALMASAGDKINAEKIFKKVNLDDITEPFRRHIALALYYSAMGDSGTTLDNLKEACKLRPKFVKLWLGISDDFYNISEDPNFLKFLKKNGINKLNKGALRY